MCNVRGDDVKACRHCGCVARDSCWHDETGEVTTEWIHKDIATHLRQHFRSDEIAAKMHMLELKRQRSLDDDEEYS